MCKESAPDGPFEMKYGRSVPLVSMGEWNGAFLALLLLVGEIASENLPVFAANVLGIFIVQLLNKSPR